MSTVYEQEQASQEFSALRARLRRFVFPATALFFSWYLLYVLLATFAPAFMAVRVTGAITVGLLLGLAQFASTFGLTVAYVRFAERRLDPVAAQLRERVRRRA